MGGVGPTSFSSSDGCQPGTERTRMSLLYIYPCVGWDPGGWVPEEVGGSKGGGVRDVLEGKGPQRPPKKRPSGG